MVNRRNAINYLVNENILAHVLVKNAEKEKWLSFWLDPSKLYLVEKDNSRVCFEFDPRWRILPNGFFML